MTNLEFQHAIAARLASDIGPRLGVSGAPRLSSWAVLDYSSVFHADWDGVRVGVYVKVPKIEINRQTAWPVCDADRHMARREWESLNYLATHWGRGVPYVTPLEFYDDLNAIVTRRAYGADLIESLRPVARRPLAANDPWRERFAALGQALREFHDSGRRPANAGNAGSDAVQDKLRRYLDDLSLLGAAGTDCWPQSPPQPERQPTTLVTTLKGLDVRNILLDDDGRMTLLDPGGLKPDVPEADLARLLVTNRILYWGSLRFLIGQQPHLDYASALLDGYGESAINRNRLAWQTAKQLVKHWRAAYVAVTRKQWPGPVNHLVLRTYVDPFYRRELAGMASLIAALPVEA